MADESIVIIQGIVCVMSVEDEVFEKQDFGETSFRSCEYENCVFTDCNFSNADLYSAKFIECRFEGCNLSLVKLSETIFRDVIFKGCKMLGLLFCDCNKFGLSFRFTDCTLNNSSFGGTKIKKTVFEKCILHEVDFTDCDLTSAVMTDCDLLNAKFENTILEMSDLRFSVNYSINPNLNKLKKAKFSLSSVAGLLDNYNIQIDKTT